ncbi:MAG: OmpA family protein [Bacteroidales bacterium]|nr:OmpA family protein [Bacteroidales bacterium]
MFYSFVIKTKTLKTIRPLVLIVLWAVLWMPQVLLAQSNKMLKDFQKAETAYQEQKYTDALQWIEKVLKKDETFAPAYLLKATIASEQNQMPQAIDSYNKVLQLDSVHYTRIFYLLGNIYYQQGAYAEALPFLKSFVQSSRASEESKAKAEFLIRSAAFAEKALNHPVVDSVVSLPESLNTSDNEYVNFVNPEQTVLIFTRKVFLGKDNQQRPVYRDEVFLSRKEKGTWPAPQRMRFPWPEQWNMGGVSFSPDGNTMYFTGCQWPGGRGSCDLYFSKKKGNEWQRPQPFYNINTSRWESQGVVSTDNRMLIFASRRPGGKGGSDLWLSLRQKNGQWGQPVDMGDSINTPGDEMAPFLHPDNRTLYFSSNGRPGMGGFDLYFSRKDKNGHWSKAQNLGYPVNTKSNELNLVVASDGSRAWLTSDRDRKGNYDLYTFIPDSTMRPQKVVLIRGVVLDRHSKQPLQAQILVSRLPEGVVVDSLYSDPESGRFLLSVPAERNLSLHVFKKGYLFASKHLLSEKQTDSTRQITILLDSVAKGKSIRLNNVYFEVDQASLQPAATPELEKVVQFLKQHPALRVEIEGHTDNTGSAAHNLKLSLERAQTVYRYLVRQGIDGKRLTCKGYGNTRPVADNTTEEGRAANRRTELKILNEH